MRFLPSINLPIFLASLLLLSLSILTIYSSSRDLSIQQITFAFIGLGLFFFVSKFDYRAIKSITTPLYILIIILLIFVFILGIETRGSIRWIPLGFINIQPSEFAKPIIVLLLARFWERNLTSWRNIFLSLIWISPAVLLIFKQPDLGTTLTIGASWLGVLFAARVSLKKVTPMILILLLVIPLGWGFLKDYQKDRIVSFISPASDPLGVGYNLIQSTIAVGSGQIFGRGLGQGTQSRLQFLPEYRTDFIFASISEELGFLGSILIVVIYLYLIVYCLKVAEKSSDLLGFLICFGVTSVLLFQIIVNIGMNIGLFPITGITLPLLSYGGSSVVTTLILLGLVSSVARFSRRVDL